MQKLIDEEFQGIVHLRTSTLHKKVSSARHDFIKLSGSENKLEALLQVYFCSDLSSFFFPPIYQQPVMVICTKHLISSNSYINTVLLYNSFFFFFK